MAAQWASVDATKGGRAPGAPPRASRSEPRSSPHVSQGASGGWGNFPASRKGGQCRDMKFAVPSRETALLERAAELSALERAFDAVGETGGRLMLVAGEAGVGKTVLLRRFCEAQDARVLWGDCDALFTRSPLGSLTDVAAETGGELADLVEAGAAPHAVAAALLRELTRRDPAIVVLEDVHWADEATLDVLRLVGRRVASVPALVIASYRDDELDRAHPLRVTLGELSRGESTARLRVAPLSAAAVAELAAPHGVDAAQLYRRTAGNAFFVTEALAAGGVELPATVRDAVLARVAHAQRRRRGRCSTPPRSCPAPSTWRCSRRWPATPSSTSRSACRAACSARRTAAWPSVTSSRASRSRGSSPRTGARRCTGAPSTRSPGGASCATRTGADPARLAYHAEGAGDAEAVLRFALRRGRARRRATRASPGGRPVRARPALRRPAAARRARRAARAALARVLPRRSVRRGDRGAAPGAGVSPAARRPAPRGRSAAHAVEPVVVPGRARGGQARGPRGRRAARAARPHAASSRWPTRSSPRWP